jgi:hypothetical protein
MDGVSSFRGRARGAGRHGLRVTLVTMGVVTVVTNEPVTSVTSVGSL